LHKQYRYQAAFIVAGLFAGLPSAYAQPTYKLDVKPHLKPLATLKLQGAKLTRTAVQDDPGFRLQYHFRKDGKSVAVIQARSGHNLDIPQKTAGTYTVVLELFYPSYKGGTQQKGAFKPISNLITFRIEPGAKSTDPVKVVYIEPPKPTLVIQCGKGGGKQEDELIAKGYGYKLLQGTPLTTSWPKTAGKMHCWLDAKMVRFEITIPPGTAGALRLHLVDGDNRARKQSVTIQGKLQGTVEAFGGAGKQVEAMLTAADTKTGKIDVQLQNLNSSASAVVSTIEFVPSSTVPPKGK
jgi:hypothetical protein